MSFAYTVRSETAKELQSSIQHGLAQRDYSTPDDPVMAEYITVMLANNKTEEQITVELADLIGPEYDATFTRWLFEEAGRIVSGAHRAPPTVKLEPEPEPVPRPRSLPRGEPSRRTSSASQRENGYDRPPHEQRRPREDLRTSNERDWDGGRQRERAIRGRVIDHWEPGMSMDTSNNEESRR